jgi:hypothetical protein
MSQIVLFAVFFVAAGGLHVLVGRWRRGLIFGAIWLALLLATRWLALLLAGIIPLAIVALIDALRRARGGPGGLRAVGAGVYLAAVVAVVLAARHFYVESFRMASDEMAPALLVGDHVAVDKLDRDARPGALFAYQRADGRVAVRRDPPDPRAVVVGRVAHVWWSVGPPGVRWDRIGLRPE